MSKTACRTVLLVLAFFLVMPAAANAQTEKASRPQKSTSESSKTSKAPSKLPLQSLTLVSTTEAARKVAEEASAKAETTKTDTSILKGTKPEADGAVIEFHAIDSSFARDSSKGTFETKSQKKSLLKNIHGSAYGATASDAGRASGEGGGIGADSGNGKFSIYVEGQHTHASTPAPH